MGTGKEQPAADAAAWLQHMAATLGLPGVAAVLEEALREALPWPWDDPRYAGNALVPGGPPLEVSFAEADPRALRFDFEPCRPGTAPALQRDRGVEVVRQWASACFTPRAVRDFERWLEALGTQPPGPRPAFGAFVGAACDDRGLSEAKIYFELHGGIPDAFPPGLAAVAAAASRVRGLAPHLASLACGRENCTPRLYFLCREELPFVELHPAFAAAGLEHRLPELVSLTAAFTGMGLVLPAGAAVLSFREDASALDCKLECLVRALPQGRGAIACRLQALLSERPETRAALRAWVRALGEDGPAPESVTAAGFRVSGNAPPQFGLYASPAKWSTSCTT